VIQQSAQLFNWSSLARGSTSMFAPAQPFTFCLGFPIARILQIFSRATLLSAFVAYQLREEVYGFLKLSLACLALLQQFSDAFASGKPTIRDG